MSKDGSIRRHGSGYEARVTVNGIGYSKTFPCEAEARVYIKTLVEEHRTKPLHDLTLGEWGTRWLKSRHETKASRHVRKEESVWRVHVLGSKLADRPLKKVQRKHIVEHFDAAVDSGRWQRQSVTHGLKTVKRALDAAFDKGLIQSNPAQGVRVKRMDISPDDPWTWLTQAEIDAVMALEHPGETTTERRALFATAIYAGLRLSELLHLKWERVFLDAPNPRIEVRAPLKSRDARRDVPLLPPAIAALRAWRDNGVTRKALGYVWKTEAGQRRHSQYDGAWRDHPYRHNGETKMRHGAKSRAGIERRVRFHDLRHTCASHLVQGTWTRPLSLHEVKDWLGHSSISVTQRYGHLAPGGIHDAARGAAERSEAEER